jgi:hypothetical protein
MLNAEDFTKYNVWVNNWQIAEKHVCPPCANVHLRKGLISHVYYAPKFIKANFWRVRKIYFDALKACTKNEELRADIPFWRTRLLRPPPSPTVAYFVCGNEELYRLIRYIEAGKDPEALLGRPLSEQGRKDIPTKTCIVTYLGRLYER